MAGLPVNNTGRLVLRYNDGVNNHNLLMRFPETVTDAAVQAVMQDFLAALEPSLYLITIIGLTEYAINSNVGFPVAWTGDASYGSGTMPDVAAPLQLRWEGYSFGGRKVSFSMWGGSFVVPDQYRYQAGAVAAFDDARQVLFDAMGAGTICAIDGIAANMKTYININYNSYWERQARTS